MKWLEVFKGLIELLHYGSDKHQIRWMGSLGAVLSIGFLIVLASVCLMGWLVEVYDSIGERDRNDPIFRTALYGVALHSAISLFIGWLCLLIFFVIFSLVGASDSEWVTRLASVVSLPLIILTAAVVNYKLIWSTQKVFRGRLLSVIVAIGFVSVVWITNNLGFPIFPGQTILGQLIFVSTAAIGDFLCMVSPIYFFVGPMSSPIRRVDASPTVPRPALSILPDGPILPPEPRRPKLSGGRLFIVSPDGVVRMFDERSQWPPP